LCILESGRNRFDAVAEAVFALIILQLNILAIHLNRRVTKKPGFGRSA